MPVTHAAWCRHPGRCGESDVGTEGPQCRARQELRRAADHQGRRDRHQEIELSDKFENMGAQMVREVASKTSTVTGDGTTTATVLAQAIVREGAKAVAAGMNPMDLKRGIDKAVVAVVEELQKHTKKISTPAETAQVGTISANGDAEIGRMISDRPRVAFQALDHSRLRSRGPAETLPIGFLGDRGAIASIMATLHG